jgi:sec-independent protein translocase protein TatC
VFLGAFVVGAVLTPPDVFSQTLLAVPMYLLYEGGMIMAKIMLPEKTKQ